MGAGPTVTLTYDLDHGFFQSKFEIPVPQICEGQLTLNVLSCYVLGVLHLEYETRGRKLLDTADL